MTTVTTNGSNASIGTRVPYAAYVGMPDFSAELIAMAQASGECYTGDKTYSGANITVDEPIYINGNLTVNGSNFKGSGCVLVSGNITFNGNNLNSSSTDAICFYSQNGNITINGSSINIDGILYAPKGKVTLNSSGQTIHGRVIADTVGLNGSNLTIAGSAKDLKSLPKKFVKLVR
ncbi:MAG: hypothetical protein HGA22_11510 [Clostridiales bacterium]|nr:hypothetical protein [Clostridiales bacterium]